MTKSKLPIGPSGKQLEAIYLLILNRHDKTLAQIAEMAGVTLRELNGWLNNPKFQEEYRGALERWTADIMEEQFANKRRRIQELHRLYHKTPDSYVDKFLQAKTKVYDPETKTYIEVDAYVVDDEGNVVIDGDGKPVSAIAVRKMNVDSKAAILKQIQEEVEPKAMRGGIRKEADGSITYVFETGMPSDSPKWGDKSFPIVIVDNEEK